MAFLGKKPSFGIKWSEDKCRAGQFPGEKPLYWMGSAKKDLLAFPEAVKDNVGTALSVAQFGGKHPAAKPG